MAGRKSDKLAKKPIGRREGKKALRADAVPHHLIDPAISGRPSTADQLPLPRGDFDFAMPFAMPKPQPEAVTQATPEAVAEAEAVDDRDIATLRADLKHAEYKVTIGEKQYVSQSNMVAELQTMVKKLERSVAVAEGQKLKLRTEVQTSKDDLKDADRLSDMQKTMLGFKDDEISKLKDVAEDATARANKAVKTANEAETTLRMAKDFAPDVMDTLRRQAELEVELQTKDRNLQELHEHIDRLQKDVEIARRRKHQESLSTDVDMTAAEDEEHIEEPLPADVDMTAGEAETEIEEKSPDSANTELEQGSAMSLGGSSKKSKKKSAKKTAKKAVNEPTAKLVLRIPANNKAVQKSGEEQEPESAKQIQKETDKKRSGIPISVASKDKPNHNAQQPEVTGKEEDVLSPTHSQDREEKGNAELQQPLQSCEKEKTENGKTMAEDIQKMDGLQKEVESLKRQLNAGDKINDLCRDFKKKYDESSEEVEKLKEKMTKIETNKTMAVDTYRRMNERLQKKLDDEQAANQLAGDKEHQEKLLRTIERHREEKAEVKEQLENATDELAEVQKQKEKLYMAIETHQKERVKVEKELDSCKDKITELENAISKNDQDMADNEVERITLRSQVTDHHNEAQSIIGDLSGTIKKLREQRLALKKQLKSRENEKIELEKTITEKDQAIGMLQQEKEELQASMDEKISNLAKVIAEKDQELAEDHLAVLGHERQASSQKHNFERILGGMNRDIEELRRREAALKKQLKSSEESKIGELHRHELALREQLKSFEEKKIESEKIIIQKDSAIGRLQQENEELQVSKDEKISSSQTQLAQKGKENEEAPNHTLKEKARIENLEREKAELEEQLRKLNATTEESDVDLDEDGYESEEWTPEVAAREILKNRKAARREKRMEDPAANARRHAATGGCHPDDSDYDTDADPSKHRQEYSEESASEADYQSVYTESSPSVKEDDKDEDKGDVTLTVIQDDKPNTLSHSSVVTILDEPPREPQDVGLGPPAEQSNNAGTQTLSPTDDDSHLINPLRILTDLEDIRGQIRTIPGLSPPGPSTDMPQYNEVVKETIVEVAENIEFIGEKVVVKEIIKENMIYCPYKWWLRPYRDLFLILSMVSFASFPTLGSLLFRFGKTHEASWNWFLGFFYIHTSFFSGDDSTPPPSPGPSLPPSEGCDDHPEDDSPAHDSPDDVGAPSPHNNDIDDEEPYVPKIAPMSPNGDFDELMTMEPPWAPGMAEIYRRRPSLLDTMIFEPVPPMPKGWTKAKFLAGIDDFSDAEEDSLADIYAEDPNSDNEEDPFADIYDEEPAVEPSKEEEAGPTVPPTAPHPSLKNVLLLLLFHLFVYIFLLFWAWDWSRSRSERIMWLSSNELTRQALISMRSQFPQLHAYSESSFWTFIWGRTPLIAREVAFSLDKVFQIERRLLG
ncbi:MAG: hypothetical protein M1812_006184 [Candelaria pacifica]|nr:MAG: hypothetical protein M1812_006184 [Candelaria pacifica]